MKRASIHHVTTMYTFFICRTRHTSYSLDWETPAHRCTPENAMSRSHHFQTPTTVVPKKQSNPFTSTSSRSVCYHGDLVQDSAWQHRGSPSFQSEKSPHCLLFPTEPSGAGRSAPEKSEDKWQSPMLYFFSRDALAWARLDLHGKLKGRCWSGTFLASNAPGLFVRAAKQTVKAAHYFVLSRMVHYISNHPIF